MQIAGLFFACFLLADLKSMYLINISCFWSCFVRSLFKLRLYIGSLLALIISKFFEGMYFLAGKGIKNLTLGMGASQTLLICFCYFPKKA